VTSLYPELRAHLLAQAGVVTDANGDPFLPDLRGEFLRGLDNGRGVDAGRVLGSAQGDAIRNITGQIGTIGANGAITGAFRNIGAAGVLSNSGGADFQADFDASRVVPTAHENRPRNVAALYCIKAFDTVSLAGTADLAALLNSIATQSEAEQGTNNTDLMTPLRTKQAIAAQTSRVHIATATANNDAVIDFTGFDSSLYISYVFQYSSMTPQTSGGMLLFRFSTDGGVSYVDTASQYQRHNLGFSPTTASAGRLTDDIANGPVKPGASGEMTLHNPDIAGKQVQTSSLGARPSTNGLSYADVRANSSVFSGPVNGIRFFMDTGAIASGTIHMYGIPR
jgi:hypothetical protein